MMLYFDDVLIILIRDQCTNSTHDVHFIRVCTKMASGLDLVLQRTWMVLVTLVCGIVND